MEFPLLPLAYSSLVAVVAAVSFIGSTAAQVDNKDITGTAIVLGSFTTLVAVLSSSDLDISLSEPFGPYTLFAPTDDAFASLPEGLVACLLKYQNESILIDILSYHVANGRILSTDLINGMLVPTFLRVQDLTIDLTSSDDGSVVKINDSTVVTVDVLTTNGVIHIINSVLVPPSIDVAAFLSTCDGDDDTEDTDDIDTGSTDSTESDTDMVMKLETEAEAEAEADVEESSSSTSLYGSLFLGLAIMGVVSTLL